MVTVKGNWAEFVFYRPQAHQVQLVGEFNGWRNNELPMQRGPDGYWRARLQLPTGAFRFRYFADGQWFADFAAFGVEMGPFGWDSVVHIAPQPGRVRPTDRRLVPFRAAGLRQVRRPRVLTGVMPFRN